MSIRILKLVSGEEIIADVTGVAKINGKEVLDKDLTVSKPIGIAFTPQDEGLGVQYYPWAVYLDASKDIVIEKRNIMFPPCEPPVQIRNQYAEMVGLPVIPDKTIITTPGGDISNIRLST